MIWCSASQRPSMTFQPSIPFQLSLPCLALSLLCVCWGVAKVVFQLPGKWVFQEHVTSLAIKSCSNDRGDGVVVEECLFCR